ncbi:methyltransferase family protein [Pleionea sediminis]|uniref:methyltransferase family protein n=1 Tax=Pleionea sediminis TaxID=2569479 RepID=UPI0011868747|nr:methyltransferase [Pleionea sediminis]
MNVVEINSAIDSFTRAYLAMFFTGVAIYYTSVILIKKHKQKSEMVFPGKLYCATWWNHMLFRFFRLMIWFVCIARWLYPQVDSYLIVFDSLNYELIILLGNVLLTFGFLFAIVSNRSLGVQWRSGIDPEGPKYLKTSGFYKYSRNPAFVAVAFAQFGFFLAIPSAFTLICLVFGIMTLQRQATAEEKHLLLKFPEEYSLYQSQTPRWL